MTHLCMHHYYIHTCANVELFQWMLGLYSTAGLYSTTAGKSYNLLREEIMWCVVLLSHDVKPCDLYPV